MFVCLFCSVKGVFLGRSTLRPASCAVYMASETIRQTNEFLTTLRV